MERKAGVLKLLLKEKMTYQEESQPSFAAAS